MPHDASRVSRFVKFVLSGGFTAVFLIVALKLLVSVFHFEPVRASVIAYILALIVNFTLQKFWAFSERHVSRMHIQVAQFATIGLINLGINTASMHVLTYTLGLNYIVAQVCIIPVLTIGSYFAYRLFIFRKRA